METMRLGGFEATPLKNENGARLPWPDFDIVLIQAIGRGMIPPIMNR
jgi:hypothetical protein